MPQPMRRTPVAEIPSDLRRAMWSVYYHGLFLRRPAPSIFERVLNGKLDESRLPMRLDLAIARLLQDHDEHDAERRVRALTKLAATGLANDHRRAFLKEHALPGWEDPLERVIAGVDSLAKTVGIDTSELLTLRPDEAARHVEQLASQAGTPCATNLKCESCYDAVAGLITTKSSADVPRTLEELAPVLDPRSWATCSHVFVESYAVAAGQGGGQDEPEDLKGYYHRIDVGIDLGKPWKGLLFEKLDAGPLAEFRNVLKVDFQVSYNAKKTQVDGIRMCYSLDLCLWPTVGGLEIDEGHVIATRIDANSSRVEVQKTVWFDDMTASGGIWDVGELPNFIAPAVLCLWLEDNTGLGPCCEIGP